jgi:hypothetical protein
MNSGANAPVEVEPSEPSVDERRELIGRVAASALFSRSARLRDFLLYVGTQSLKEGRAEIHEQEIGAKVFGRSPAYDRSQDNIVRVNATELRKRIDLYFATEGAHETLILEIPRGAYKPVFHWRTKDRSEQAAAPETLVAPSQQLTGLPEQAMFEEPLKPLPIAIRKQRTFTSIAWVGISAVLAIVCAILWQQNQAMRRPDTAKIGRPEVEAFWKAFGSDQQGVDIVLPDASVGISEEITHQRMSLNDYLSHTYVNKDEETSLSADRVNDLHKVFSHSLVTLGDFHAAQQILALTGLTPPMRLDLSRGYTADLMKRNGLILIGGRKANPWVGLFDDRLNFSVDFDSAHGTFVSNRHPQQGEQGIYAPESVPNEFITYSVIAYLPNPSRTGNVIILAGADSDATNAAAEFLTSEASMSKFRNMLKVRKIPHFEILLKVSQLNGTAFNAEVLTYRTYPEGT